LKILSFNNTKAKEIIRISKKKLLRYQQNIIIVEGKKEIKMALKKYRPHELFLCKKNCGYLFSIENKFPLVIEIQNSVFKKLVYRKESGGFIATFHSYDLSIKELLLPKNPIILVLVAIEKPGNLGAILRSAEAIGTDVIVLIDIKTDIFHPNVIRSSLGTIFIHNIFISQSDKLIKLLQLKQINILATSIRENTINLYECNLRTGIALILGNESIGLSFNWINYSNRLLKVPLNGNLDSLNVSNAVAVILFEALRQRM
jgi:TrmH family RNA methyltransferase